MAERPLYPGRAPHRPRLRSSGGAQGDGTEGEDSDQSKEDRDENGRGKLPSLLSSGNVAEVGAPQVAQRAQVLRDRDAQRPSPDAHQSQRNGAAGARVGCAGDAGCLIEVLEELKDGEAESDQGGGG